MKTASAGALMDEGRDIRSRVHLDEFRPHPFDRGRSRPFEAIWILIRIAFFQSTFPWPMRLKRRLLIAFGATVGRNLVIRPRVYIHFPWKLTIGSNCWIGERCEILNLENIHIDDDSALAHDVYLAAGGHDIHSPTMSYANAPIVIEKGVWIATRAFIGPGVTVQRESVVAAGSVVISDVPCNSLVAGVPARVVGPREIKSDEARHE
jgi:putative colanic acid biosynthesis acetyltransferase WcaF